MVCSDCAGLSLREQIELAAYCGHEGARRYLHGSGHCGICDERHPDHHACMGPSPYLRDFVSGLQRWGQPVLVRAAIAAGRVGLGVWADRPAGHPLQQL